MGTRSATPIDAFIGEKIRGHRNQMHLSQDQLGTLLGITFQQIQKYEKGLNRISASRLQQLADVFDCEIADFLPIRNARKQRKALSNVDRMVATRDGMKLVNSFVSVKDARLRAAIVDLAARFEGL